MDLGRLLVVSGLVLIGLGLVVMLAGRFIPLGGLPGDLRFEKGNFRLYVPIASSILVSLVLTLLVNVVLRLFHR